jgi:hypothetical protein
MSTIVPLSPPPLSTPAMNPDGTMSPAWVGWLTSLYQRVGSSLAPDNAALAGIVTWTFGAADPPAVPEVDGAVYCSTATGNVYQGVSGSWELQQNIKGPAGATGPAGVAGPSGPSGPSGPTGPTGPAGSTGATGPQGSTGATGATGPTGAPGTTGAAGYSPQWIVAAGVPSSATGNVGDMYLNSSTQDVYGPKSSSGWGSVVDNIKGAAGPQGPAGSSANSSSVQLYQAQACGGFHW